MSDIYTNRKFIPVLTHMLAKGKVGSCVIGTESYAAINSDNELRATYNNLIEQGLEIGFNPTIPAHIHAAASDNDLVIENMKKGAGLVMHDTAEAQQIIEGIDEWYQQSVHLTNFDLPVEDLEQAYEATKDS